MRNKTIVLIALTTLIIGCNDNHKRPLVIKDDIDNLFNFNHYRITQKRQINDSIFHYIAENDRFLIKGKYNDLKKNKIGWWNAYDKRNNEKYLDIQFFTEYGRAKELNNQIIFYKKNKIDTSNSKFYKIGYYHNNKTILYNFYCSKSSKKTYSAKINIGIISDNKPLLYPIDFDCKKIANGKYQYSLDVSKYNQYKKLNIIGLFSEYSTDDNRSELGIDQIFIEDTIKIE